MGRRDIGGGFHSWYSYRELALPYNIKGDNTNLEVLHALQVMVRRRTFEANMLNNLLT